MFDNIRHESPTLFDFISLYLVVFVSPSPTLRFSNVFGEVNGTAVM